MKQFWTSKTFVFVSISKYNLWTSYIESAQQVISEMFYIAVHGWGLGVVINYVTQLGEG